MNSSDQIALLRIIDANANRAAEGLRVVEEYARFVLEDRHLATLLKQLRHELSEVLLVVPAYDRCAARETQHDVGTSVATSEEYQRETARDVAAANQKRVEQSLRSLEEFLKPLAAAAAVELEQLRYRAYTLGRALELTAAAHQRLESAQLYVLIDGAGSADDFDALVRSLIEAEVHILQLRDKQLDELSLLQRARRLRQLTRDTQTLFVMNDRADLAVLSGADGVHVGQDELPVKDIRSLVGPDALIGVSTHSIQQARQAVLDGASYIGCGPTFRSQTKSFDAFPGLALLREVAAEISLPAFAIGGITLDNLPLVLEAGLARVAVGQGVLGADHPAQTAGRMVELLAEAQAGDRAS